MPFERSPRSEAYRDHRVFSALHEASVFYDHLSIGVMQFPTLGTRSAINIDTYVLSSMAGTLRSIGTIVGSGQINDGFALLRKYFDSIFINIYTNVYLEDNCQIDNYVVDRVVNWLNGREKLPAFREMSGYVRSSSKMAAITALLYGDSRYTKIRDRCNDNTHYNFYINVMLNDGEVHLKERVAWLDFLVDDIDDLFVMHFAYLFTMKDHYMMSSDYLDSLEFGSEPVEGSQYWVAPFIQSAFARVQRRRPDIAAELRSKSSMAL